MNSEITRDDIKKCIDTRNVTGYVWYIDKKNPQVFKNESFAFNSNTEAKCQIQEAYLTNETGDISIRIINSDGIEHCFINKLEDFKTDTTNFKVGKKTEYPSHINNIECLTFNNIYKLTPSLSDEGFNTWQPVLQFFTGLTKK